MNELVEKLYQLGEKHYQGGKFAPPPSSGVPPVDGLINSINSASEALTRNYVEALHYYNLVLKYDPNHRQACYRLAEMYYYGHGTQRSLLAVRYFLQQSGVTSEDKREWGNMYPRSELFQKVQEAGRRVARTVRSTFYEDSVASDVPSSTYRLSDLSWGRSSFWEPLGDCFYNKNSLKLAEECYSLSIECSLKEGEAIKKWSVLQLAAIASEQKKPLAAIKYIRLVKLSLKEQAPYVKTTSEWKSIAKAYDKKEKYHEAILYYQCALAVAKAGDQKEVTQVAERLAEIYYIGYQYVSSAYSEWEKKGIDLFIFKESQPAKIKQSIFYYRKALEGGSKQADLRLNKIGVQGHYSLGLIASTKEEAIKHWQWAAFSGNHTESMFLLGLAYKYGSGVKKSVLVAAQWLYAALQFGSERARRELGDLAYWETHFNQFFTGRDKGGGKCKKDYAEALFCAEWMLIHASSLHDKYKILMRLGELNKKSYKGINKNLSKSLIYYMAAEAVASNEIELDSARENLCDLKSNQWLLSQITQHGPRLVWMSLQLAFFGWQKKALSVFLQGASTVSSFCLDGDLECAVQLGLMMTAYFFEKTRGGIDFAGSFLIGSGGQFVLQNFTDHLYPGIRQELVEKCRAENSKEGTEAEEITRHFSKQKTTFNARPNPVASTASLVASRWSTPSTGFRAGQEQPQGDEVESIATRCKH